MPRDVASSEPGGDGAPWWVRAFGAWYPVVYAHRDDAEATRNAPGIARLLALPPGARVLDVGCGAGRYARALAALGLRVTGVDLSESLLAQARRRSPGLPGAPTYVRADMRDLPFGPQFDGAVSLFTSFGYFERPEDDARVVASVARALVPGGRFLLDVLNAEAVLAAPDADGEDLRPPWRVTFRRRLDPTTPGGPYVRKRIVVSDLRTGRDVFDVEERVRVHDRASIDRLLVAAGLEPVGEPRGDLLGAPASAQAPRFVRVARRRAGR